MTPAAASVHPEDEQIMIMSPLDDGREGEEGGTKGYIVEHILRYLRYRKRSKLVPL